MEPLPELFATRAVHQYRRRDILAYVSLRQYLKNRAALREIWSEEIACSLVSDRQCGAYNTIQYLKEVNPHSGEKEFRPLHIPGPNEIMAETALLAACARAGSAFRPHSSAFSYRLSVDAAETRGVFKPYFEGFKARHQAIAAACEADSGAVVIYTDIRRYYPSISITLARRVWSDACANSDLADRYRKLGEKLLVDYAAAQPNAESPSILTGPLFSHLIADLLLRRIDEQMATLAPNGYFRYVDDVAIVAGPARAAELEIKLASLLGQLGLSLHEGKRIETSAALWLEGKNDFADVTGISWTTFVGDMKRFLLFYPEQRENLTNAFKADGIRIIPLDYSVVEQERSWLERVEYLLQRRWFRRAVRSKSATSAIVTQGLALRVRFTNELDALLMRFDRLEGYERKRKLYRLRFLTARLVYLAHPSRLASIGDRLAGIPEMAMTSTIYHAIAGADVTALLSYGPTAAQAAAQPLRAMETAITCGATDWTKEVVIQAYGVLRLNGLTIQGTTATPLHPMVRFCDWSSGSVSLFEERDSYFRELGCIHGVTDPNANRWAIETAFDRDDDMVFDMQEIMQASS